MIFGYTVLTGGCEHSKRADLWRRARPGEIGDSHWRQRIVTRAQITIRSGLEAQPLLGLPGDVATKNVN